MAQSDAFPNLPAGARIGGALYAKFEGRGGIRDIVLNGKDFDFADVVAEHHANLVALLDAFRDEATGYMARPFPQFASRFNAYDHLARVKEWAAGTADEDDA